MGQQPRGRRLRVDFPVPRPMTPRPHSLVAYKSLPSHGVWFSVVRALTNAAPLGPAFFLIYIVFSRRIFDFSDDGFYYTCAWLAYSHYVDLPVNNLFMNFGNILGLPYLLTNEPTVLAFRFLSLSVWYLVHFAFFFGLQK